jgi:dTMP kinase
MAMLIEFAGIDGCGKTTQANLLHKGLLSKGIASEIIPSSQKPLSDKILEEINENGPYSIKAICSLSAANDYFWSKSVKQDCTFYILDRYIHTSIAAYLAMSQDRGWILRLYQNIPMPEIILLLDLPSNLALQRKAYMTDPYEEGSSTIYRGANYSGFMDYQSRVRESYLMLAEINPLFCRLNAIAPAKDLETCISEIIQDKFCLS